MVDATTLKCGDVVQVRVTGISGSWTEQHRVQRVYKHSLRLADGNLYERATGSRIGGSANYVRRIEQW